MTSDALVAPHSIEYTYTRSTGPMIGAFMTGLRDGKILGVRGADGRVHVPAIDYDPVTSEDLTELVEVADTGVVTTWSWNDSPREGQPLSHPFAWALVRWDGADTAMLVAVDCGDPAKISAGAKVKARWAKDRTGTIHDIECCEVTA